MGMVRILSPEAVQECWEWMEQYWYKAGIRGGIYHKAGAFIQGKSLDFHLLFLVVQDQVIF